MAGVGDDDGDKPMSRSEHEAWQGPFERSARSSSPSQSGPAYVHTVPRDRLRPRTDIEVVHVSPLQRLPARIRTEPDRDELDASVSPLLVLGIIVLLIVTFIAATQLR